MSSSSSSSTLYRTQSDTLKLQRLIEVLKERGSDLGSSLETSANELLADVKPKSKETSKRKTSEYSATSQSSQTVERKISLGAKLERHIGLNRAEGFDDSDIARAPPPTPVLPPPGAYNPARLQGPRSTPPPPKIPPPPLPEDTEMIPSMRRRGSALAKLGLDPEKKKKVHFQEEDGVSSISQLVQKSSAVLRTLTLSLADKNEQEETSASSMDSSSNDPERTKTTINGSDCAEKTEGIALLEPTEEQEVEMPKLQEVQFEKEDVQSPSLPKVPIQVVIEAHSEENISHELQGDDMEIDQGTENKENEPEEDEENITTSSESNDQETGSEWTADTPDAMDQMSMFSKDDPPDPNEVRRLPKPKKKQATLATRWRKQRERERSRSRETSPFIMQPNFQEKRENSQEPTDMNNDGNSDATIPSPLNQ